MPCTCQNCGDNSCDCSEMYCENCLILKFKEGTELETKAVKKEDMKMGWGNK